MFNHCIRLDEPEPMMCTPQPANQVLYKCWVFDDVVMLFHPCGVSRETMRQHLELMHLYTPHELVQTLRQYGLVEVNCLGIDLVDSKTHPGRLYTSLYEDYLVQVSRLEESVRTTDKGLDSKVAVAYRFRLGDVGCGCNAPLPKPRPSIPPPPWPLPASSPCICIRYRNTTLHYVVGVGLSNIKVEQVLRNYPVGRLEELTRLLKPILMERTDLGVLNGVLK